MRRTFLNHATKHLRLTDYEKAVAPDERIVAQAARYMRALKSAAEEKGLEGARLLHAEQVGVKCEWQLYRVRFELKKP
ncbi:hypothetical protein AU195_09095 [Mycobacterium sp. IS-1496]|uniref:hypothetical protein n=1 Tax=Mycobacterium sp. IS-1496 TaxID=1772284 RepID=UPI0007415909|nr:hypothetical protein [Mycobacterium sp. IS-1496]KUI34669.1 hypothetical protein AU195_09095 [Mycobacterium sp. IS-1496]